MGGASLGTGKLNNKARVRAFIIFFPIPRMPAGGVGLRWTPARAARQPNRKPVESVVVSAVVLLCAPGFAEPGSIESETMDSAPGLTKVRSTEIDSLPGFARDAALQPGSFRFPP